MVSVEVRKYPILILQTAMMMYWGSVLLDGRERTGSVLPLGCSDDGARGKVGDGGSRGSRGSRDHDEDMLSPIGRERGQNGEEVSGKEKMR